MRTIRKRKATETDEARLPYRHCSKMSVHINTT